MSNPTGNLFPNSGSDPLQASLQQLLEVSAVEDQMEDELHKLILMSYTMKNSFYICELMYNTLGDVQGEQAAKFGALNEVDSALGNLNADGQSALNAIANFLQESGPYVKLFSDLSLINAYNTGTGNTYGPGTSFFEAAVKQFVTDAQNLLPSSVYNEIAPYITALQTAAGQSNGGAAAENALVNIQSVFVTSLSGSSAVLDDVNKILADYNNKATPQTLLADVAAFSKDINASSLPASTKQELSAWAVDMQQALQQSSPDLIRFGGDISASYQSLFDAKANTDANIGSFVSDMDGLASFIQQNPDLFSGGAGQEILSQIDTVKQVFGSSWGNQDDMASQMQGWFQQANQQGTAPQQLQTLSGAIQSIDRATDAQSTSSRMQADYTMNIVKQLLGGQESFVQAPLQAESGFVHNQKTQ